MCRLSFRSVLGGDVEPFAVSPASENQRGGVLLCEVTPCKIPPAWNEATTGLLLKNMQ